jgi:type I restriction enzyme S subunit
MKGYKHTELGWIPEDWEVKKLKEVSIIKGEYGINAAAVQYSDDLPTYLRITDIDEDGYFIKEGKVSVLHKDSAHYYLEDGDVVFARTGATVGKTYLHQNKNGKLVFAGFLIRFRPDKGYLLPSYLKLFTNIKHYWDWVSVTSMRSGQPGINGTEYCELKIPIPSILEQERIVIIISAWDKSIEVLNQLIEAKLQLKKGVMKQLLTGIKRLPGFKKKWAFKSLGEVLDYEQPSNYLVQSTDYHESIGTPVLTANKSFILGYTEEIVGIYNNVPVIIFDDFTTLSKYVTFPFKVKSSAIKILKLNDKTCDLKYVYERLQLIKFAASDHKRYWISEYQDMEMQFPNLEEQKAISNISTLFDAEIQKLGLQLQILKHQKQGLMQQLLTGKKRVKV